MKALFTVTLFSTAFLLFFIEPLVGKLVLPLLGGTPAVWNTCLLFFQTLLLAGYGFAHGLNRLRRLPAQLALYLGVLLAAITRLPIHFPAGAPTTNRPELWLLGILIQQVGLPFLAVAVAGPLLQNWFARTDHERSRDPYFLYAASNLGSVAALLSYPFFWEPRLRLSTQCRAWAVGYEATILLIALSAGLATRRSAARSDPAPVPDPRPPAFSQALRWVLLAWIPSSLMIGVTSYLTMDVAPIPLLWVIPLLLYLSTFVIAFSRRGAGSRQAASRLLAPFIVLAIVSLLSQSNEPAWIVLPLHLVCFFLAALVCHGKLAEERPPAEHLTAYYLWIAVGGWLGGVLNVMIAPLVFTGITEYPLALIAACFFRQTRDPDDRVTSLRLWAGPIGVGLLTASAVWAVGRWRLPASPLVNLAIFGPAALLAFRFLNHRRRFAASLALLALGGASFTAGRGREIFSARNFFGITRVMTDPDGRYHFLYHGETLHGGEKRDPASLREPLFYYVTWGPAGQVFGQYDRHPASPRVGLIGLGSGGLAAYARPGESWTFYEVNPAMEKVAQDDDLFSFLSRSPAPARIVMGDARLQLQREPDRSFGLLVLDAFDSDAIPTHLVTEEAFALYERKLAPHGLLLFHISNRYLDLRPLLGSLCARVGLIGRARRETVDRDPAVPEIVTDWAVLARSAADLGPLAADPRWVDLPPAGSVIAWTDDYSNLMPIFRW